MNRMLLHILLRSMIYGMPQHLMFPDKNQSLNGLPTLLVLPEYLEPSLLVPIFM